MRDSVATETGDQTVASAGRGRRALWAILSFLFVLGIAVSTIMVRSQPDEALDAVVETGHEQAQLATATLTGKQLTKPATGSSYDKLAAGIRSSVPSDGAIVGVTIWSSKGRILFSSNESRVGKTPAATRSLITRIANGSGSARVVDGTVQTFTPVSKASDGRVAVVQIDQPVAAVDAQIGDLWSMLRLVFGFGLAVSLLLLILAFVRPRRRVRAREHEGWPERGERQEGDVVEQPNADGQSHDPRGPSYEEVFADQFEVDDETLEQHADLDDPEALEGDPEAMKSIRQWDETYEDIVLEEIQAQELMRQRREEFKARAEAAALRVKKLEAEPQGAPPTPD